MSKKALFARLAVFGALAGAAGFASAADAGLPDVSGAVSYITSGITIVSSLGVAALSVVVAVRLFKWVRGAL